jgi:hypothetical protein
VRSSSPVLTPPRSVPQVFIYCILPKEQQPLFLLQLTIACFGGQLKTADQSYSIGAFLGKDPEDVRHQKQEKLEQQIVDVNISFAKKL